MCCKQNLGSHPLLFKNPSGFTCSEMSMMHWMPAWGQVPWGSNKTSSVQYWCSLLFLKSATHWAAHSKLCLLLLWPEQAAVLTERAGRAEWHVPSLGNLSLQLGLPRARLHLPVQSLFSTYFGQIHSG